MLGYHYLVDYFGCNLHIINDAVLLEEALPKIIRHNKGTILGSRFHQFTPHGVTGVILLAESHFAIHTWPEFQQVCLDIFSCGENLDSLGIINTIKDLVSAKDLNLVTHLRGQDNEPHLAMSGVLNT